MLPADPALGAGGDFTATRFVHIWDQVHKKMERIISLLLASI
jgi:hypothetical protein